MQHCLALGLAAEKDGFEVDVEDPVPLGFADFFDGAADRDTGAVDADIQAAPGGEDGIDHVFDLALDRDVSGDGQSPATQRFDLVAGIVGAGEIAIGDGHVGTGFGVGVGVALTDAGAATGDQGLAVVEGKAVEDAHLNKLKRDR